MTKKPRQIAEALSFPEGLVRLGPDGAGRWLVTTADFEISAQVYAGAAYFAIEDRRHNAGAHELAIGIDAQGQPFIQAGREGDGLLNVPLLRVLSLVDVVKVQQETINTLKAHVAALHKDVDELSSLVRKE